MKICKIVVNNDKKKTQKKTFILSFLAYSKKYYKILPYKAEFNVRFIQCFSQAYTLHEIVFKLNNSIALKQFRKKKKKFFFFLVLFPR